MIVINKLLTIFILIITPLLMLISCSTNSKEEIEVTEPKLSLEQEIHSDMTILDYASDDRVIFHGSFGLFIYDIKAEKIIRSLDLEAIDLQYIQGDNYCEVTVNNDGSLIQLNTITKETMYTYNIENNTLIKSKYKNMENKSNVRLEPFNIKEDSTFFMTYAIKFNNGDVGYLISKDHTIGSLEYIREDKHYKLFKD